MTRYLNSAAGICKILLANQRRPTSRVRETADLRAGAKAAILISTRDLPAVGDQRRISIFPTVYLRHSLLIAAVLGMSATYATAACTPSPELRSKLAGRPKVEVSYQLGNWYGERQQYGCAAQAYRAALRLQPDSAELSYLLGLSLYLSHDPSGAIGPLRRSVQIAPGVLKPHLLLAEALARADQVPEAVIQWRAALQIDPNCEPALRALATGLLQRRKYGEVVALLHSAVTAVSSEDLVADLAEAYTELHSFADATKLLTDALGRNSQSLHLANKLITVYMRSSQDQAAEELCKSTLKLHPNDLDTEKLYLQVALLSGNRAVSRPLARRLLGEAPHDFDVVFANGVIAYDDGSMPQARDYLQSALEINPRAYAAHYRLGLALQQLKDDAGAREQFHEALQDGATEPEVHLQLAKTLQVSGKTQEANQELKLYQQALQSQQSHAQALSKSSQGDGAMAAGDPAKARAFYQEALAATPNDAQLNYKLATALDKLDDIPSERSALDRAIQLDPDLAVAQNQLGFLDSKGGDPVQAEQRFREAVRAAPDFTEAWVNLAATLGLESRFQDAQNAVDKALQLDPKNAQALLLQATLKKVQPGAESKQPHRPNHE